jgi:Family of unknown function (DUF5871)
MITSTFFLKTMDTTTINYNNNNQNNIIEKKDDFKYDYLTFATKSHIMSTGCKLVTFNYNSKPLCIQTPVVNCPFGFTFERDRKNYKLCFTPEARMIDLFNTIDTCIIDAIMARSLQWFDKSFNSRIVLEEGMFNSSVKQVKQYAPHVSTRLKFDEHEGPKFGLFDKFQDEIVARSPEDVAEIIPRGTKVRFLLVSSCIWYVSGRCGYSWDVLQIQVMETPLVSNARKRFMFVDSDEKQEEEEEEELA